MFGAVEVDSENGDAAVSPSVRETPPQARFESESSCRSILGVPENASWDDICAAHARLVSDMTPGPGADHSRVQLALSMLDEVDQAFATLQRQAVA